MHHLWSNKPLLCRELVGREQEMRTLHQALQRAAAGQPQLLMLTGEAGIGKTKLCRAFIEASGSERALILSGQAISQDQASPFGPFLDAFHRYMSDVIRSSPHAHQSLPAAFSALLQVFPELTAMFPDKVSQPPPFPGEALQGQQAVFYGVLQALQELAISRPVPLLLILEDLHWADETSLELLAFLVQRLDMNTALVPSIVMPLMIIGTYRVEALYDNPALRRLLLQLHSQRQFVEMRLAPLPFAEHQRCVSTILEQPASQDFAKALFDWDEGNPFFTEELLGAMAATGQLDPQSPEQFSARMKPGLSSSLTALILDRFARLAAPDQDVLSYAAVIGREFDFPLLAALSGLNESELVMVLRQAVNAQLISEVSDTAAGNPSQNEQERYQFRHALTHEAIYSQLLAPERRIRHRAVAETIEKLSNTFLTDSSSITPLIRRDTIDRLLAEHYWHAGLFIKARPHALHEAEHASRLFAFREERYYLQMAQSSFPENSPERLQLLRRMGIVSMGAYDFSEAIHWLGVAKEGYLGIGQPHQAHLTMAMMLLPSWFLASPALSVMLAELEDAVEGIFSDPLHPDRTPDTLVISSLIATYRMVEGQFFRSMHWIEGGLALYEELTDVRKVQAIQLSLMSVAMMNAHKQGTAVEQSIRELRRVLHTALTYNLPDAIMFSYAWLPLILLYRGKNHEAEQILQEAVDFEQRSGTQNPTFVSGWLYFFSGKRWNEEIEVLRGDVQRLNQIGIPALAAIENLALLQFLLARGELDEAESILRSVESTIETLDQFFYLTQLYWSFAKLFTSRGDAVQASLWYERILNRWKMVEDMLYVLPVLLDGIACYADFGDLLNARNWLEELQGVMQVSDNPVGAAALQEAQGVFIAALGDVEEAIALLRQAVAAWRTLQWRYRQALASQRLASLLLQWASRPSLSRSQAQAAREEAAQLLGQAEAIYTELDVSAGRAAVQALRSETHLEAQEKRRHTLLARSSWQGLTPREMDVLTQLAAGLSNKEIAAALHISIGTVEQHISHIFARLGCDTRTQAVAIALERGWIKR